MMSQFSSRSRSAFTLIELLIVVAIIAVMATASFLLFFNQQGQAAVTSAATQVAATLREAQSRAVSQDQNVSWGVHFANTTTTPPFYALFSGSYTATTTAAYYPLPTTVVYVTSTLPVGSSMDIIFSQISGTASASTSISLRSTSEPLLASATISVASSGEVSF